MCCALLYNHCNLVKTHLQLTNITNYSVVSQRIELFITTAVRTSNPTTND
jgi:hypothetical protein